MIDGAPLIEDGECCSNLLMDNVVYALEPKDFFNMISEVQADYIANNVHGMNQGLVNHFTVFFKQSFDKHNVEFVQDKFDQILDMCAHIYRARWLLCGGFETVLDDSGKFERRVVCKTMNYLRFNKCVEYSYIELVNANTIVMNLGYSKLNVVDDLAEVNTIVDSSQFFKNLMNRVELGLFEDEILDKMLNSGIYTADVIVSYLEKDSPEDENVYELEDVFGVKTVGGKHDSL